MRSQSNEDYLKAIYLIQEQQNGLPVSTSSLASRLGVANASVTGMLKRFAAEKNTLVEYEPYSGVKLTHAGEKMALEVIRHHRLLESYLNQMLGFSWDQVHEEAERLEHVISEEMEDRLALALGNPTADPHGDPIPDREGHFHQPAYQALAEIPDGQPAEIRRVIAQEPALLRYLSELGLGLSTQIEMVSKAPFNGPVTIRVNGSRAPNLALAREVALKIFVVPVSNTGMEQTPYEQSIQTP
jgi:DtxR family Mn-dependent transcriptional regulator